MARYTFEVDGNYVNFKDGINTLVRLHNSSRCIEWSYDDTTGIKFRVEEFEIQTDTMSDIDIDGNVCSAQGDFETYITDVFTGLAGGAGGGVESVVAGSGVSVDDTDPANPVVSATGSSYLVYRALLSQTGTDAPTVVTELENSLGGTPVWAYGGTGYYTLELTGAFPKNKTQVFVNNANTGISNIVASWDTDPNKIYVQTFELQVQGGVQVAVSSDNMLVYTPIYIIVNP